jgi:hypothetical protein
MGKVIALAWRLCRERSTYVFKPEGGLILWREDSCLSLGRAEAKVWNKKSDYQRH